MKITKDVRKYAAQQGITEEEALEGMEEKVYGNRRGEFPRYRHVQMHLIHENMTKQLEWCHEAPQKAAALAKE